LKLEQNSDRDGDAPGLSRCSGASGWSLPAPHTLQIKSKWSSITSYEQFCCFLFWS